jgi:hypothetical protein
VELGRVGIRGRDERHVVELGDPGAVGRVGREPELEEVDRLAAIAVGDGVEGRVDPGPGRERVRRPGEPAGLVRGPDDLAAGDADVRPPLGRQTPAVGGEEAAEGPPFKEFSARTPCSQSPKGGLLCLKCARRFC